MLLSHLVARCQIFLLMNKTALPLAVNKLLFQLWQDSIPGLLIARWTVDHCVIGLRLAKVWQQSCWSEDHFFRQCHLCMKSTGMFETFARENPASLVFFWFADDSSKQQLIELDRRFSVDELKFQTPLSTFLNHSIKRDYFAHLFGQPSCNCLRFWLLRWATVPGRAVQ